MALQANSDPALIALAHFKNLEVGKHYTFATDPLKVYKFESIGATTAVLLHKPFFGAFEKLEVERKDLKRLEGLGKVSSQFAASCHPDCLAAQCLLDG